MDYFDQNSTLIKHLSDDQDTGVLWYNNSYDTGDQPHHKLGIFYSVKEFDPINITFRSGMDYWAVKPVGEIGKLMLYCSYCQCLDRGRNDVLQCGSLYCFCLSSC